MVVHLRLRVRDLPGPLAVARQFVPARPSEASPQAWPEAVLADAAAEPGYILANIDPGLVTDARARIPTLVHARTVPVHVVELG